ncbi:hypothetical protein [Gemmatimonas sp.]|uniref:hypothetical protein n=1 Tax=Gemmatimonas sp. TaxID=1962908 RepID=UPI00286E3F60|nr:hypothetical protein [Gemmatimonas sp.]
MERSARTSIADLMQEVPAVPAPPTVPTPPPVPFVVQTATGQITGAPTEVYQGALAQRRELRNQLERLESQRQDLRNELRSDGDANSATDRAGVEARIKELDARISSVDQQLARADAAVAQASAIPGATTEPPRPERNGPPEEIIAIPIVFTLAVLMPLAIAYSRRIWKKGATVIAPIPKDVTDRLDAMGQAVESIAIEVERIGEGQRFLTRVMSDKGKSLGVGAAEPIPVPQAHGQPVAVPRYER